MAAAGSVLTMQASTSPGRMALPLLALNPLQACSGLSLCTIWRSHGPWQA